jgi:tight adherence protein B
MESLIIVGVVIFVIVLVLIQLSAYAFKTLTKPERRKIHKRLRALSLGEPPTPNIMKKAVFSNVPLLNSILSNIPGIRWLHRLMEQANAQYTMGFFVLVMVSLALAGYFALFLLTRNHAISFAFAGVMGGIPLYYLRLKKKRRIAKLMRQLPEGLELIARALRAGHAFTSGMELVSTEFDDPLGPEFDKTLDEINYGVSVHDALKALASRIDCPDLSYFVVSVILQRETGGNLAEIIDTIAHLIRERFKLQGKVRVLTAEGRLSAVILIALPFVALIGLRFANPDYVSSLFSEPSGRLMAGIAAMMMLAGILVIRRMVRFKV